MPAAAPARAGTGGLAVLAHNGRPLFVPVGLARAAGAYLPRYRMVAR